MFLRRRRLIAATGLAAASSAPAAPRHRPGRPPAPASPSRCSKSPTAPRWSRCASSPTSARAPSRFIFETLIMQNLMGQLEPVPGLAESWKRIDERTVELALRKGVKLPQRRRDDGRRRGLHLQPRAHVRPGLRHHSAPRRCSPRCWSAIRSRARSCRRKCRPSPSACSRRSRRSRRSTNTRCASSTARPTSRWRAASAAWAATSSARRAYAEAKTWMDWARSRWRPAPTRCASSWPTSR